MNLQTNETYEDIFQNRFPDKLFSLGSGFRKPILGGWRVIKGANNLVDIHQSMKIQRILHKKSWDTSTVNTQKRISTNWQLPLWWCTLQRQNTEISKQIFPEKEYRGLSPNFHIHALCVIYIFIYIPTISLPILQEEICRPILGLDKSLTDTWMWKLGLRPQYSQKRTTSDIFVAV